MTDKLKTCAHCGGDASTCIDNNLRYWAAYCLDCAAGVYDLSSEEEAIAAWNRRTEPAGSAEPSKPELNSLGIANHWSVTVEAGGNRVLCISDQHYAGVSELEPYVPTIENAAKHLLSFIGCHQPDVSIKAGEIDMAFKGLLRQVEFVLSVTGPLSRQQSEVWPELKARAEKARALLAAKGGE